MNNDLTKNKVEEMVDEVLNFRKMERKQNPPTSTNTLFLKDEQLQSLQNLLGKNIDVEQFIRLCIMIVAELTYIAYRNEKLNLYRLSLSDEKIRGIFNRNKYPAVIVLQIFIEIAKIFSERILKKSNNQIYEVLADNIYLKSIIQACKAEKEQSFADELKDMKELERVWGKS